jgi:hypothetical protein
MQEIIAGNLPPGCSDQSCDAGEFTAEAIWSFPTGVLCYSVPPNLSTVFLIIFRIIRPKRIRVQMLLTITLNVSKKTGNCGRLAILVLYNIEVANAMAERCKESAFVGKESRFFTMVFFLDLVLPTMLLKSADLVL